MSGEVSPNCVGQESSMGGSRRPAARPFAVFSVYCTYQPHFLYWRPRGRSHFWTPSRWARKESQESRS